MLQSIKDGLFADKEKFALRADRKPSFYYQNFYVERDGETVHLTQQRRFPTGDFQTEYDIEQVDELLKTYLSSDKMYAYDARNCLDPFKLLNDIKNVANPFEAGSLYITELEGAYNVKGYLNSNPKEISYRFFDIDTLIKWINEAKSIDSSQNYDVTKDSYIFA